MALPLLTADLPGTGGVLRSTEDDFQVEELPAYLPQGEGEHLYLWVEKRGLTTQEAVRLLAKRAGLPEREVGYAGLKDKRAVTRQWISLPASKGDKLRTLAEGGLKVLDAKRHLNKLRPGHLRGNRFLLGVRGVGEDAAFKARAVLERLAAKGVPNAYGPQRFGRENETSSLGRALLTGAAHPQLERAKRDRYLKRLALSAFQSELFNRLLALRLGEATWDQALLGDVLQKPTGASFVCEDPGADQPRLDRFELSVAGPMFGPKLLAASGPARERELKVLAEAGVDEALFAQGGELTRGARRALRVPLGEHTVELREGVLWVGFTLPRGSYASVVMAEVMKGSVDLPEPDDD